MALEFKNIAIGFLDGLGRFLIRFFEETGRLINLFITTMRLMVKPPFRLNLLSKQMEFVGVQSTFIVALTGTFTGMVFALQSSYAFKLLNAEGMIAPAVGLSLTRELAPVLTGLMVTGRVGSAMAAELGTMRVTEQIDALFAMAIDPIKYLVVPRVIAGIIMVPLLTILFNFVGNVGSYIVGVGILGLNSERYINDIVYMVDLPDLYHGVIKAGFFGLLITLIGCSRGFYSAGGAEGVGRAATQAVVIASVLILVSDYFLTSVLVRIGFD
ncbi:MAG: ABC transporter permease [Deltaproteobacteria bacterium]|nr:MAG: ABC transporter permease [Deltaproteobacteria bacterium]